jgi:hypothetical protein
MDPAFIQSVPAWLVERLRAALHDAVILTVVVGGALRGRL